MARVVVVGAGVAGLAAAVWLADFGHDVVILERRDRPGGQLCASVPGPMTFTLPAVLRDLFGKTGRRLDRELDLRPVDPAIGYVTSAGPVTLPNASRSGSQAAIRAAFGDSATAEWDRLMRRAADVWALTRPVLVDRQVSRLALLGLGRRRDSRGAVFGTLGQQLRDLDINHPAITEIIAARAVAVGADPHSGPATVATWPYLEQTFGVWSVEGGPTALVGALAGRAAERGAVMHTATAATRYEAHRGRIVAVHAGGERLPADIVISAVPHAAHRRLLGRRDSAEPGATSSVATIVLPDVGADIVRTMVAGRNDHPWCVVESVPGTGSVIHVDVERGVRIDDDWADTILAGLVDRGFHLPASTTHGRWLHAPDDLADDLSLGELSPHGPAMNGRFAALRRPRATTATRGLSRVGASTGAGPGVHTAALSAAVVADLVGRPGRHRPTS